MQDMQRSCQESLPIVQVHVGAAKFEPLGSSKMKSLATYFGGRSGAASAELRRCDGAAPTPLQAALEPEPHVRGGERAGSVSRASLTAAGEAVRGSGGVRGTGGGEPVRGGMIDGGAVVRVACMGRDEEAAESGGRAAIRCQGGGDGGKTPLGTTVPGVRGGVSLMKCDGGAEVDAGGGQQSVDGGGGGGDGGVVREDHAGGSRRRCGGDAAAGQGVGDGDAREASLGGEWGRCGRGGSVEDGRAGGHAAGQDGEKRRRLGRDACDVGGSGGGGVVGRVVWHKERASDAGGSLVDFTAVLGWWERGDLDAAGAVSISRAVMQGFARQGT